MKTKNALRLCGGKSNEIREFSDDGNADQHETFESTRLTYFLEMHNTHKKKINKGNQKKNVGENQKARPSKILEIRYD